MVQVGDRFESVLKLSAQKISEFAKLVGDTNPIHHDADFAARSRFGNIIVSGPHLCSLMMGATGAKLSEGQSMLGVSFEAEFKHAVRCDEEFLLTWEVTGLQHKASGALVVARITIHVGERLCVTATNRALVFPL